MKKWLKKKKLKAVDFGHSLPVVPHWTTVSRWMNGHTKPSAAWYSIIRMTYPDFPEL